MKNANTRSTARGSLLKGHRYANKPVTDIPGGRMGLSEDVAADGFLLHVGEDVVATLHRSVIEVLHQENIAELEDGSFRVTLAPMTLHLRMSADELNSILSLRRSNAATPSFDGAALLVGGKADATSGQGATAATETTQSGKGKGKATKAAKPAAAKAAKPAKVGKNAKAAETKAASTKPARGKKVQDATANAPVSLDERRRRKQASTPAAAQTELPGLGATTEAAQPSRKAARSANTVQRLREPMPAGDGATRTSTGAKGARRKATSEAAPGGRGTATKARSSARGSVKGTATKPTRGKAKGTTGEAQAATTTQDTASVQPGSAETVKKATRGKATRGKATKTAKAPKAGKATTARSGAKVGKATPAKARAGRTATATPQVTGEAASVVEVKEAARKVILAEGRPLPRRELLNLVQTSLGRPVPGKDPIENLATILYKDKDKGFTLVKSRGFWVNDRELPQA